MVHQGEAISGHYWSYIYDHYNGRWLKFNDTSIAPSTWEEVVRESEGGTGNASAYCLMYVHSASDSEEQPEFATADVQQCIQASGRWNNISLL